MVRLPQTTASEAPTFDPTYLILFEGAERPEPYRFIVPLTPERAAQGTRPHGLDLELLPILDALGYCLYLPRTLLDTVDLQAHTLVRSRDLQFPHHIVPLATRAVRDPEVIEALEHNVTLVIAATYLMPQARELTRAFHAPIEPIAFSDLNDATLRELWKQIAALYPTTKTRRLDPPEYSKLGARVSRAPFSYLARQFNTNFLKTGFDTDPLRASLHMHVIVRTTAKLEEEGCVPNEAIARFPSEMEEVRAGLKVHVALGCPGVAPAVRRRMFTRRDLRAPPAGSDSESRDAAAEATALSFLVEHRACATNGIGLCLPRLPDRAFTLLDRLEGHCTTSHPDGAVVVRDLERLGRLVSGHLGEDGQRLLEQAASVTAFSDFPFSLVMLPTDSAPICCRKPIAHRPLTPLTRALEIECFQPPASYFKHGFDVLVAECLEQNDPLRKIVAAGWNNVLETLRGLPNTRCDIIDVTSVAALNSHVRAHRYDVLVLSGHGFYNRARNAAGLIIGGQPTLGEDFERVPPLTILSACHVAPRGIGVVSISDLLLMRGASAVLGTLIPVEGTRNAILMSRLFVYMHQAITEPGSFRSLDQVWQWVTASNAVNEILASGPRIIEWTHGKQVIKRFMLERSSGRMRARHIYADTISVLQEMANEDGFGQGFRATLKSQGYFPESLFYIFIGRPDRIILHDDTAEKMRAEGVMLS
jgi:hypothetical protein